MVSLGGEGYSHILLVRGGGGVLPYMVSLGGGGTPIYG